MINPNLQIRNIAETDLTNLTHIHMFAFPDSALTKLGFEPVRRYYEWLMVGPHDALNIGVFEGETLIGFCFGGIFRGALGGFLEKNRNFLIQQVMTRPWLLFNPLFRERATFAFKRVFQRKKTVKPVPAPKVDDIPQKTLPSFGILSIAVSPKYQGMGASKLLMEYSEKVARDRGFTRMGLTVHPSNGRAVRFYEKMGWQKDAVDGVWSGHMSKILITSER